MLQYLAPRKKHATYLLSLLAITPCTATTQEALFSAIEQQAFNELQNLFHDNPTLNVNTPNAYQWTPLYLACNRLKINKNIVALLIQKGADVNAKQPNKQAPLHEAIFSNDQTILKLFLQPNLNINTQDKLGGTPLHNAASNALDNAVTFLLTHNADANKKDFKGNTPLHAVASVYRNEQYETREKIIKALLNKNAIIDATNNAGETPLYCAVSSASNKIVRTLVSQGAKPKATTSNKNTLLHSIVKHWKSENKKACEDIATLLIAEGVNIDAPNKDGNTPLHLAINKKCEQAFTFLLAQKANVNVKNDDGDTPLHLAAQQQDASMIDALLKHGAKKDQRNNNDQTPVDLIPQSEEYLKACFEKKRTYNPLDRDNIVTTTLGIVILSILALILWHTQTNENSEVHSKEDQDTPSPRTQGTRRRRSQPPAPTPVKPTRG